jgi:cell division septation protein DedD
MGVPQQAVAAPAIVEAPPPQHAPALDVVINTDPEADLSDFAEESAVTSMPHSRWPWVAAAAAVVIAVSGVAGGAAWQTQARLVEDVALSGLLAPPAARTVRPALVLPLMEQTVADSVPPQQTSTTTASTTTDAATEGGYSIVVASFESRTRAERLVEELTTAGFHARAVERDAGPSHPALHQVTVGAYNSAIDVQRALQHIRELPGRYADARIVGR